MRLAGAMVRILPKDHDAHCFERSQVKRAEPFASGREDAFARGALGREIVAQRRHIGLREFLLERREPARMQLDVPHCPHSRFKVSGSRFPS
jgi:hypothetical protein